MPTYLAETFMAAVDPDTGRAGERAARSAARALTRDGTPVRLSGSIYVPDDEICLLSFEAPTASDVERVVAKAGLRLLRVVEAIPSRKGATP
jgi:hypothetical protein